MIRKILVKTRTFWINEDKFLFKVVSKYSCRVEYKNFNENAHFKWLKWALYWKKSIIKQLKITDGQIDGSVGLTKNLENKQFQINHSRNRLIIVLWNFFMVASLQVIYEKAKKLVCFWPFFLTPLMPNL